MDLVRNEQHWIGDWGPCVRLYEGGDHDISDYGVDLKVLWVLRKRKSVKTSDILVGG